MISEDANRRDAGETGQQVYLVVRAGPSWREIFRLEPGTAISVGRDAGNRIVLPDDRCSRHHCLLEQDGSDWQIRDLGSRNGTFVDGTRITAPRRLDEGTLIAVGGTELLFTQDISRPLDRAQPDNAVVERRTVLIASEEQERDQPLILERRSQARFLTESELAGRRNREPGVREAFATLYRLMVRMISSSTEADVCQTVLNGLLPAVGADIGAVLLFPERTLDRADPNQLRIVSYIAPEQTPYRRVSARLSALALQHQEAILGMAIGGEPQESQFQSLEEMDARSVICAPIRSGRQTLGLLHLYSLRSDEQLDEDALDLVLAVGDHLATMLDSLAQKASLTERLQRAQDQYTSLRRFLEIESDLIGDSLPMRELRDRIARVAASGTTILIRGESGVGKELVARAIHFNSARSKGPFVCVNCAALTESLLESELFGHEKGAFTGATERRAGKFEQAHQGTLFLDEIGEMPPTTQAKLLRVLEGHAFERVGGNTSVQVDVRLVAATNRDLEEAVQAGEFRADLLFRVQVVEVAVPPLREHASDVPILADYFLQRACERSGRPRMHFAPPAMEKLRHYDWPGNVRELKNLVERTAILLEGPEIRAGDLPFTPLSRKESSSTGLPGDYREARSLEEVEKQHILRILKSVNWKKREAARILGINRSTLDRKLASYDIQPSV